MPWCVQSPGPINLGTLSQTPAERERSAEGEGGIRTPPPPIGHCICPERGSSLDWGLRRMTHVSHEVMGDNKLVSNDRCVEGGGGNSAVIYIRFLLKKVMLLIEEA